MHDIKTIRKNPDIFKKKISERNTEVDIKKLLELDRNNRELIQNKEKLEQEKKIISQKKDKSQFAKSKELSLEIEEVSKKQITIKQKIDLILSSLPNIALDDVPIGRSEKENKEIEKIGKIPQFSFKILSHSDLGIKHDMMDFEITNKTSGARFVVLKNDLALLERAISNFMLDTHTKDFGYTEVSPPLIVNDDTMFGTGQLPKLESDQFEIKLEEEKTQMRSLEDKYLSELII